MPPEFYSSLLRKYNSRVAFGVGHLDLHSAGFVNVDCRDFPHMDVVIDVGSELPFGDESISEILAESVLEHIAHNFIGVPPNFRMTRIIEVLREWRRVLKPNGKITIKVPNLEGVFREYLAGRMSVIELIGYVYGGGEYEDNCHRAGFDKKIMSSCLRAAGFREFKFTDPHQYTNKFDERKSWEMGVVVTKSSSPSDVDQKITVPEGTKT